MVGLSLDVPSTPSHFQAALLAEQVVDHRIDIRKCEALKKLIHEIQPDFVFHLAAQALVKPSYEYPLATLTTNAIGSANVLESMRTLDKSVVVVMITSDKAYDNVEWVWGYRETDRLGGKDPYSASKGMAELAIRSYIESFPDSNAFVGIARAGNVIGGGDWAQNRIVPDCMRAWSVKREVDIRSPFSTRPWQHVLEPLSGYLLLAAKLFQSKKYHGESYNFGPPANQNHSVHVLIDRMSKYWDHVRWNDVSDEQNHIPEAGLLKLNCDKALSELNWQPTLKFEETVKMTVEWYKHYYEKGVQSMYDISMSQINEYTELAKNRKLRWAKND